MFTVKRQGFLGAVATLLTGRGLQIVLGFVHLQVVLSLFGGGSGVADTYFLAFSILALASGVAIQSLTFTLVPVFTEWRKKQGEGPAWEMASTVLNISLLLFSGLALLVYLLAPRIAALIDPGHAADGERMALLAALIRILAPGILFAAAAGVPRALYASYRSFIVPAIAALAMEAGLIAGALAGGARFGPKAVLIGGVIGVAVQAALLATILFSGKGRYRPGLRLGHEGLKKFGALLAIRLLGIAASQVNLLVDRGMATLAEGEGNVTALVASFKIANFFPQILIWGICEAIIALFSSAWTEGDRERVKVLLQKALRALLFLAVPCAVFLAAARTPVVALLFERNEFTADDTARAALPLLYYSFNLPFALVNFLLLAVLWAMQDSWNVLKLALVGLVVNVSGDFLLLHLMGYSGIAMANLPRGVILTVLATAVVCRKGAALDVRALSLTGARLLAAGVGAYFAVSFALDLLGPGSGLTGNLLRVAAGGAATAAAYLLLCTIAAPREIGTGVELIRSRLKGGGRTDGKNGKGESGAR